MPISLEEYLHTSYRPDCEYIDGAVQERHLGEMGHSILQREFTIRLHQIRKAANIRVYLSLRVQVSPTRIRVPDVTVTRGGEQFDGILRTPPLLMVEVLSSLDTMSRLKHRICDYLAFGVEHIWLIEPETRTAYIADASGLNEPAGGSATGTLSIPGTPIACPLAEIWAELEI